MTPLLSMAAAVAIQITGCHDGDTCRAGKERIRLANIDAPEVRGYHSPPSHLSHQPVEGTISRRISAQFGHIAAGPLP